MFREVGMSRNASSKEERTRIGRKYIGKPRWEKRCILDRQTSVSMPRSRLEIRSELGRLFTKPLQGALNLLILKTLRRGAMHGYGIASLIEEASEEVLQVEEGSLYPALHKMEHDGWITSTWAVSDTNRRVRYYRLTAKGERQLATEEREYARVSAAIAKALKYV